MEEDNLLSESIPTANVDIPMSSMERRKRRKSVDKEKHKSSESKKKIKLNSEPKSDHYDSASNTSSGAGVLPELHMVPFKELAFTDVTVRERAARALAMELREVQNAYDKLENKDEVEDGTKLEAEKDDGLNNCAPSLRYAVRRLIRGVSSPRECARQGFALGLTILVGTVPAINLKSLLNLIISNTEVNSSMKGKDARDCLLGRLFAYGAVARTGKLSEEYVLNDDTPLIKEFTSSIISLAAKKRYLQDCAVEVILEMAVKLPTAALLNHVLEAPGVQQWFEEATVVGNPDALHLALKMREKVGDANKFGNLLPCSPYSKSAFFSADHLSNIANCLKESTFCQPRVHNVWPVLVDYLLSDVTKDADSASGLNSTKKPKRSRKGSAEEDLQHFFEVIIEGSLLPSSHDRKKLAFDVLLLLLQNLPASFIQVVLSYKVVQCLLDILSTKDSWLYKVAQHFLKSLSERVVDDDVRRVEVIVALQKHSNGKFDNITRSKTVKDLMTGFKTEPGCLLVIQNLVTMFLDEGNSSEEPSDQSQTTDDNSEIGSVEERDASGTSEFLKSWIVESLPNVSKHLKLDQEANFRVQKEVLKFLAVQGLFSSSLGTEVTSFDLQEKFKWPKSAIPGSLRQSCIEQIQLLLASVQKGEGSHAVASGVEANDLGSYFMRFMSTLCGIPSVSLSRTLSGDDEQAFKKLQAMESQLFREEHNCGLSVDASKLHALRYLLIQLLLQILLRPGDFFEAASELVICCKKAFGSIDLLESGNDENDEDEMDEDGSPELMDVLVDTMLSLLPSSSAPMRSAIEKVFKYFCSDLTEDGLLRMLRVIKKDLKRSRHQNTDSEDEDADDDIFGVEESDESEESEMGETAESDEQTDDSEAVMGMKAVTAEHPEASDGDESDGGLDDDAMFRIDEKLAHMVREKIKKTGVETAHSQLVLFKLRVLSLLEIYVDENPGKPEVLKVFSSLAQAYANPQTTEGSEQLGQRIWGIIQKNIFKAKDFPRGESLQLGALESLLEKYLKLAGKPFKIKKSASTPSNKKQSASWNRHKTLISLSRSAVDWILKIVDARNFPETELEKIYDIFKNALSTFFDSKKCQLKPDFLKVIVRRWPWIGHKLFGFILENCTCAKINFRQVEAFDLVTKIIKYHKADGVEGDARISEMLKKNLPKVCDLIKHFLTDMLTKKDPDAKLPGNHNRRASVRRLCVKIFESVKRHGLNGDFLKGLDSDCHSVCEKEFGKKFLVLKEEKKD